MKKYLLEIVVFICGAIVMVLEIVGSRIVAPFLGNSIVVWTSLIGIILGSLSIGYWWGGKISDQKPNKEKLSFIIFLSGLFVGLIFIVNNFILSFSTNYISNFYASTLLSAIFLFSLPSILLGMVSPYAVRLKLSNLDNSGSTVGNLYSVSTIGSIFGTFLAGFFLIPLFGSLSIILFLGITLIFTSISLSRKKIVFKIILILIFLSLFFSYTYEKKVLAKQGLFDIDTRYSRVKIFNFKYPNTEEAARGISFGPRGIQSAIFLDSDDLVFDYTKFYNLGDYFNASIKNSLMIGGAGYSYPKYFLTKHPGAVIDVVEIDSKMTEIAKKHFRLKEDDRLNIIHKDARVFLNKNQKKYDTIYIDAFSEDSTTPYYLTTQEAVKKVYDSLNDDGVALMNIIGSVDGDGSDFFKSEYKTYKSIFPQVFVFLVKHPQSAEKVQNIILVALKSDKAFNFHDDPFYKEFLKNLWEGEIYTDLPILTDNYAPVDYYNIKLSTRT